MFALGRLMARTLVGRALGVAPDAWPWREGPHGRPEIDRDGCGAAFQSVAQRRPRALRDRARTRRSASTSKTSRDRSRTGAWSSALLLARRSRRHSGARRPLARALPDLLDAERGVPQGPRPRDFGAAGRISFAESGRAEFPEKFSPARISVRSSARSPAPTTGGRFTCCSRAPGTSPPSRPTPPTASGRRSRCSRSDVGATRPPARHQRPAPQPSRQSRGARGDGAASGRLADRSAATSANGPNTS